MNVYKVVDATTSETKAVTEVEDLRLVEKPHAFFLNYQCHGYAKFIIDDYNISVFQEKLYVYLFSRILTLLYS